MRLDDLLEKKEAIQIQLLRQLVLAGGQMATGKLREQSSVSKSAFEQYIQGLEQEARAHPECFTLKNDGVTIVLQFAANYNLEMLLTRWVSQGIYFQLMDFVLHHPDYTTVQLINELGISESTLFRKIRELNKRLQEFHIQFKNGSIQGEELQIRYVYYQLYSQLASYQQPTFLTKQPEYTRLIHGLERHLDVIFSISSLEKITVFWAITQKRWLNRKPQFERLKQQMQPFLQDQLYQSIDEFMTLYLSRTAIENNRFEGMMFYIFLISFEVFDEESFYQFDLMRSKKLPTAVLDTYVRETILLHYRPRRLSIELEKKVGYQLAHINNELYFFIGKLELYDRRQVISQQRRLLGRTLSQLLTQLLALVFAQLDQTYQPDNTLHDALVVSYASILTMIDFSVTEPISIALDFTDLPPYRFPFYQLIQLELRPLIGVVISDYQKGEGYDLVVSTKPTRQTCSMKPETVWYVLSEFDSLYDIQTIKQTIEEIRHHKN